MHVKILIRNTNVVMKESLSRCIIDCSQADVKVTDWIITNASFTGHNG